MHTIDNPIPHIDREIFYPRPSPWSFYHTVVYGAVVLDLENNFLYECETYICVPIS